MSRGGEDPAWELMQIREYDKQYGLEEDCYAFAEEGRFGKRCVVIQTIPDMTSVWLGIREARCLAASLLRAADEAEKV